MVIFIFIFIIKKYKLNIKAREKRHYLGDLTAAVDDRLMEDWIEEF